MKAKKLMKRLLRWLGIMQDKVLFIDLDGTLIETYSGNTFPTDKDDWLLRYGISEAIIGYNPTSIHIVTNQGGVESGYVTMEDIKMKLNAVVNEVQLETGIDNVSWDVCPSNKRDNPYRKPNPGMLDDYMKGYTDGNVHLPGDCLMVGDASGKPGQFSKSDKVCAERAGVNYMDVEDFIEKYGIL